jgi:hypothetical protein
MTKPRDDRDPGDGPDAGARPAPTGDRPAFAARFPEDPELDRLVRLFEAGDYGAVRQGAPALARSTDRDEVRRAARLLAARLDPDPLAKALLAVAGLLLAALTVYYYVHAHAPPP